MGGTVTLPIWAVVLAGLLAAVGLVDRLLRPAARWYLRRRVNRAIEELNSRLQLKIRPFGTTRRSVLIDRLTSDPAVVRAVEEHARAEGMPVAVAMQAAVRYAREIVPAFNAYAYFRIGARLARALSTSLYRVRIGYMDRNRLSAIDPEATVVFVMNHRSNMDYVLVTFLASTEAALSYAVGEWARVPVLQTLIRSMGAYFIRRDSRNSLYRRVLSRYVQMATEGGVAQAVFPEGGLSRDGLLRPVRLGILSYIAGGFRPEGRDVVFVPVGLNYDRVLEDRSLIADLDGGAAPRSTLAKTGRTIGFLWRNLLLRLSGRWHRFGYACVSFGEPVSLKGFLAARDMADPARLPEEARNRLVGELGQDLMAGIARVIPALPVPLVATALLAAGAKGLDELALKAAVGSMIDMLAAKGAHVHIPHADRDYAVTAGLAMLRLRHLVVEGDDGLMRIAPGEDRLVAYYANAIAHLF